MNQINELETQLRMWGPRRPSAALRERLFSADSRPQPRKSAPAAPSFRLSWLAPAAVCLVVMCFLSTQQNPVVSGWGDPALWGAVFLSNHSASAYLPGSYVASSASKKNVTADS